MGRVAIFGALPIIGPPDDHVRTRQLNFGEVGKCRQYLRCHTINGTSTNVESCVCHHLYVMSELLYTAGFL
jgi:hypothetical protein